MLQRMIGTISCAALLALAGAPFAHAHHPMGYATPATWTEGLLSGLGHPVLGVDHLVFILAAGVLATRLRRGFALPLVFVLASNVAVALRAGGIAWNMSELWVAGTLVALGGFMLARRTPGLLPAAALVLAAGALHGYALAEAIVGAEATPIYAYLAGLTIMQCGIAYSAAAAAAWIVRRRPALDLQRLAGMTAGAAGLLFAALALA